MLLVALNDLGQVAWLGKNDEGTPTVYLRGPVDTLTDTDGDARSDAIEGKGDDKAASRDTDGDTTPDYLDLDSDNDGLPDTYDPTAYDMDNPTPLPLTTAPLALVLTVVCVWRRKTKTSTIR